MAMFLAETAFLLELGLFAAGLVLWHQGRQASAGLLRGAGAVLVLGSVLTALCTGYFSVRYQVQGEFDHAYAVHHATMAHCPMMKKGRAGSMQQGHEGMMMGPGETPMGKRGAPKRPGERGSMEESPGRGLHGHHPEDDVSE